MDDNINSESTCKDKYEEKSLDEIINNQNKQYQSTLSNNSGSTKATPDQKIIK